MENILVDIRNENEAIKEVFQNKDLVSVDEMLNVIDDLKYQIESLKEEIEDLKKPQEEDTDRYEDYVLGLL